MLTIGKRGQFFHATFRAGTTRVRGTLGTRNGEAARQLARRLETALSEGPESRLWPELKAALPDPTFTRFAKHAGVKERKLPTWGELREAFETHMAQRVTIGKFRESTKARYKITLRDFGVFLQERNITLLQDVTRPVTESFKAWKMERIKAKKFSRGGEGLAQDAAILHRAFSFAVENDWITKNPVRMEGRPGDSPRHGAEPFTAEDLSKMREHAGDDLLAFLLLRHTGLRGGDAVTLTWGEVRFDSEKIERVTRKRGKKVILPIHPELLRALEWERDRRKPQPTDPVLLNPFNGTPLNRPRLYERMKALGTRAGVPNAHPHRFRDTRAVDLLLCGAGVYDVAKALGDTVETVERHYAPFIPALQERLRRIQESPNGLEGDRNGQGTTTTEDKSHATQQPQQKAVIQ
jgi:integrase